MKSKSAHKSFSSSPKGEARNVCCPKSSQGDLEEKTVGEGQNGWVVPGEKREMTEERRIGRGIRKAILEGHIGSVPGICRKWRDGTWSIAVLAPF